jgi:hypothetical protein
MIENKLFEREQLASVKITRSPAFIVGLTTGETGP